MWCSVRYWYSWPCVTPGSITAYARSVFTSTDAVHAAEIHNHLAVGRRTRVAIAPVLSATDRVQWDVVLTGRSARSAGPGCAESGRTIAAGVVPRGRVVRA